VEVGDEKMGFDLNRNATTSQNRLSRREIEIIALVAEGQTNRAIADQLGIAPETIKTYLKRIFTKLDTHSRAEAVVLAQTYLSDAGNACSLRRAGTTRLQSSYSNL
jgi:DNA-binding CsgD family transcriptional regulator